MLICIIPVPVLAYIVEVDPETTDADSALHAADIAMYQEKKHKQKTPFVAHPALHS